ncbi:DNA modification methylase [Rhizorhabdus wittichii]|uniref:DNA modification methylase n=1 Tax=Rhizorhabdus wittichii TaxID=160791 RepID=UPI00031CC6E3|nr:DNA modification methylase [Rhizorhabdus wittichii]
MTDHHRINLPSGLKRQVQERNRRRLKGHEGRVKTNSQALVARNDPAPKLRSERWPLDRLKDADRRTRRTSPVQLERVMQSVSQLGFLKPVIISADGKIVDGHILVEVARRMGVPDIACVIVDHLSPEELRLARIALNRIQETGEWDLDELSVELEELQLVDLDLVLTGFDPGELDLILDEEPALAGVDEHVPERPRLPVSEPGDLWLLDGHRLLCGDALDPGSYALLLDGRAIDGVFSDPPYNIKIEGVVSGLGKTRHKDFAMGVGEMSDDQFRTFLGDYLQRCREHASPGAVIFACMDWRQVDLLMLAGRDAGLHRINKAVWHKGSGGMGSLYRSAYEEVVVFCTEPTPATNNVLLGRNGRNRTNLWTYAGANRKGSSAGKALADHPTPKPVELVVDALQDVTKRGDLVFDPFMGSGTTLVAAQAIGRIACGIELDPGYVDVAVVRWQQMTGKPAVHAESGKTFEEVGLDRSNRDGAIEAAE